MSGPRVAWGLLITGCASERAPEVLALVVRVLRPAYPHTDRESAAGVRVPGAARFSRHYAWTVGRIARSGTPARLRGLQGFEGPADR